MANLKISEIERTDRLTQRQYDKMPTTNRRSLNAMIKFREKLEAETGAKFTVIPDEFPDNFMLSLQHGDYALDISGLWKALTKKSYMVEIWKITDNGARMQPKLEAHYAGINSDQNLFWLVGQLLENFEVFSDFWDEQ
jgi:hypothetical protein